MTLSDTSAPSEIFICSLTKMKLEASPQLLVLLFGTNKNFKNSSLITAARDHGALYTPGHGEPAGGAQLSSAEEHRASWKDTARSTAP